MRVPSFRRKLWPTIRHRPDQAVSRDADELMATWGEKAFDAAARMSWQEDTGLLSTAHPGHWWRVRREVGRRLGRQEPEPQVDFVA